jgi:hypothetical protein
MTLSFLDSLPLDAPVRKPQHSAMNSFANRITRRPIPYDLAMAQEAAQAFAAAPPDMRDLIAGAAGCSPYLKDLLRREGGWLTTALHLPGSLPSQWSTLPST